MLRVSLCLCLLIFTAAASAYDAPAATSPTPIDARIQKRATTPTYVSEPTYAHSQCANQCQVRLDRAMAACHANGAAGSAVFACMKQARMTTYLGCVNACPVDAARVKTAALP